MALDWGLAKLYQSTPNHSLPGSEIHDCRPRLQSSHTQQNERHTRAESEDVQNEARLELDRNLIKCLTPLIVPESKPWSFILVYLDPGLGVRGRNGGN